MSHASELKAKYNWATFRRWMEREHADIAVPMSGCIADLRALFERHRGLRSSLIAAIRVAPGDRATVIACARNGGWWPKGRAVADIRKAPGDRATVIYYARQEGWWPKGRAVADIRVAPGNRAWVIRRAREEGWWPKR